MSKFSKRFSAMIICGFAIAFIGISQGSEPASAAGLPNCNAEASGSFYPVYKSGKKESVNCVLGAGNSGSAVRILQYSLGKCNGIPVTQDGSYGAKTKAAVARIQKRAGLKADGVYGPATRKAMKFLSATGRCFPGSYLG